MSAWAGKAMLEMEEHDVEDTAALLSLEGCRTPPHDVSGGRSRRTWVRRAILASGALVGLTAALVAALLLHASQQPNHLGGRPSILVSTAAASAPLTFDSSETLEISKDQLIQKLRAQLDVATEALAKLGALMPPRHSPTEPAASPTLAVSEADAIVADDLEPSVASGPAVLVDPNSEDPIWGCGLLGHVPGIDATGEVTRETQDFIDVLKRSSSFGKVSFWNWNLAPMTRDPSSDAKPEFLSEDFVFMPEQWGAGVVEDKYLRPAGEANFQDDSGRVSAATMGTILLGMNEPDIKGSCMGNMFGKCEKSCSEDAVAAGDCPRAELSTLLPAALPNAAGECNCWEHSHATGVGFWPFDGCEDSQPLPHLWADSACVDSVMEAWKKTAEIASAKGYKYLSTPLLAVNIDYAQKFIEKACGCVDGECSCIDASCGCPVYVGFHFYAYDCRPAEGGGYAEFKGRLGKVRQIMEKYDFVKGAIINEIGMLNCRPVSEEPICVPDSGVYPAANTLRNACPATDELPNGLGTFIEQVLDIAIDAKTSAGKRVVKGISWFNANMAGGTYNLELFNEDGSVNDVGRGYMRGCAKWAGAVAASP